MFYEWQQSCFNMCGYHPTKEQWKIHLDNHRKKLVCGGERAGKSYSAAMELIARSAYGGLFWLVGHDYEATRGEWLHLVENFDKLGLLHKASTNIDPGTMTLVNGGKVVTKSAKYPRTLATLAPDGILLCEAAQADYETYLRLDGRIAEKRGWLFMSGTLEFSEDWYSEFYKLWSTPNEDGVSFSLPTWSNIHKFPGGRTDEEVLRLERGITADRFQERYGGIPCPPSNRIITEFSNRLHVSPDIEFNRDLPVELAIDPGYGGAYSILALQKLGEQVMIFDEIYKQGLITEQMILLVKQKPWWSLVDTGVIDIAAKQHPAMQAPIEMWRDKANLSLRCNKVFVEDGIDVLRTYLTPNPVSGKPLIQIHPSCQGLISEMGGCKSPVPNGGTWKRNPDTLQVIDKNNHSVKALIYWLVDNFGYADRNRVLRKPMKFKFTGNRVRET